MSWIYVLSVFGKCRVSEDWPCHQWLNDWTGWVFDGDLRSWWCFIFAPVREIDWNVVALRSSYPFNSPLELGGHGQLTFFLLAWHDPNLLPWGKMKKDIKTATVASMIYHDRDFTIQFDDFSISFMMFGSDSAITSSNQVPKLPGWIPMSHGEWQSIKACQVLVCGGKFFGIIHFFNYHGYSCDLYICMYIYIIYIWLSQLFHSVKSCQVSLMYFQLGCAIVPTDPAIRCFFVNPT